MNLNTARKALRESRTISLRRSLEAGTMSPGASVDVEAARESAAQEAVNAVDSAELESALLLPRGQRDPQGAAAAQQGDPPPLQAEASADSQRVLSARPSLTSPEYQQHRDSRALWRLARTNLGACACLGRSKRASFAGRNPVCAARCGWVPTHGTAAWGVYAPPRDGRASWVLALHGVPGLEKAGTILLCL